MEECDLSSLYGETKNDTTKLQGYPEGLVDASSLAIGGGTG
jgi:hypothetical protein